MQGQRCGQGVSGRRGGQCSGYVTRRCGSAHRASGVCPVPLGARHAALQHFSLRECRVGEVGVVQPNPPKAGFTQFSPCKIAVAKVQQRCRAARGVSGVHAGLSQSAKVPFRQVGASQVAAHGDRHRPAALVGAQGIGQLQLAGLWQIGFAPAGQDLQLGTLGAVFGQDLP